MTRKVRRAPHVPQRAPDGLPVLSYSNWFFGIWRGLRPHRTTIEPSTRQFGLPA